MLRVKLSFGTQLFHTSKTAIPKRRFLCWQVSRLQMASEAYEIELGADFFRLRWGKGMLDAVCYNISQDYALTREGNFAILCGRARQTIGQCVLDGDIKP